MKLMPLFRLFLLLLLFADGCSCFAQTSLDSLFSVRGGIYATAQTVSINTSNGYTVYYTLDGRKPNSSSAHYSAPITLSKPTVVRALFYQGGIPKGVSTQTYVIGRTFNMAVISIAAEPEDFFSYERGIYAKGCCADSTPPYQGGNFWKGWERPINIEMYEPDNTLAFNQGAGVRIFGGFSKGLPMKSLAILAKEKYGSKKFKYQIFPNKPIEKFNSFVLRNSGGDFNNTHFRDALLTDLTEPIGMDIQAYRPCVVYINGAYWGIHNIREKLNEHYLADNYGVDKDSVDLLKHKGDVQVGKKKEYQKLLNFLNANTFTSNEKIQELNQLMDIDNYIDYNITEIYVDNGDAGGNIRYWREQKPNARWRWILFDLDLSFGIGDKKAYKENTLFQMTNANKEIWPNPAWSTFIIRKLLENDSIQNIYVNRFADHLNTIFSEANVHFKIDSIYNLIDEEMPYHIQKWPMTLDTWNERVERLKTFSTERPHYLRAYLMEKFELKDTVKVTLLPFDKSMGKVQLNSLSLKGAFEGWYFTDCPIVLKANPKIGYEFIGWEGLESKDAVQTLSLTKAITLKPIFKKRPVSALNGVIVINEISLKQDSLNPSGDWLELYNTSAQQQDLSGWKITTKDKEKLVFPAGSTIGAQSYIIVCKTRKKFQEVYELSEDLLIQKDAGFGFAGKKELIRLFDQDENQVDSLEYELDSFPSLKDTDERNIERINPKSSQWNVSEEVTPGTQNNGYKALPKSKNSGMEVNLWWVLGGITALVILIFVTLGIRKKKGKFSQISKQA